MVTSRTDFWVPWIGKKHRFAADPTTDEDCDCFLMAVRVREGMGLPAPSDGECRLILQAANENNRKKVIALVKGRIKLLKRPEAGSFTFIFLKDHICVYSCVGDGILHVHLEKGVRWSNTSCSSSRLRWYHWH